MPMLAELTSIDPAPVRAAGVPGALVLVDQAQHRARPRRRHNGRRPWPAGRAAGRSRSRHPACRYNGARSSRSAARARRNWAKAHRRSAGRVTHDWRGRRPTSQHRSALRSLGSAAAAHGRRSREARGAGWKRSVWPITVSPAPSTSRPVRAQRVGEPVEDLRLARPARNRAARCGTARRRTGPAGGLGNEIVVAEVRPRRRARAWRASRHRARRTSGSSGGPAARAGSRTARSGPRARARSQAADTSVATMSGARRAVALTTLGEQHRERQRLLPGRAAGATRCAGAASPGRLNAWRPHRRPDRARRHRERSWSPG